MWNLLPAIMLLLVQGMGDVEPTFRHQQALLDLAQRVGAVQNIEDLEDLLNDTPGLDPQQIVSWLGAFYALHPLGRSSPDQYESETTDRRIPPASSEPLPEDCFLSSARTRDGPSL